MRPTLALMMVVALGGCAAKELKATIRAYGESAVDSAQTAQVLLERCEQGDSPSCQALRGTLASWQASAKILQDVE